LFEEGTPLVPALEPFQKPAGNKLLPATLLPKPTPPTEQPIQAYVPTAPAANPAVAVPTCALVIVVTVLALVALVAFVAFVAFVALVAFVAVAALPEILMFQVPDAPVPAGEGTSEPIARPRFVLAVDAEVAPVPPLATGRAPDTSVVNPT
jgi:hypothetical protein